MRSDLYYALIVIFSSLMLAIPAGLLIGTASNDRDSTDPKDGRSGMRLYTDAMTGCQYLSAGGGITPRLDSDNMIVCNEDSSK